MTNRYYNDQEVPDYSGDFLHSHQEAYTYIGKVVYAFTWLNLYVISPVLNSSPTTTGGRDGSKASTTLELAAGSDGGSLAGTVNTFYSVGSYVMVYSDTKVTGSMSLTDYIIGPAAAPVGEDTDGAVTRVINEMAPLSKVSSILTKISEKLKSICGMLPINAPKAFTSPTDALGGDTSVMSSPDTGISVLKHIVRIQCGKGCFIELDSILSRIRVVSASVEYIGPLKHTQDLSEKGSLLDYQLTAVSFEESSRRSDNPEKPLNPMFRRKDIAGDVTSGWETAISIPSNIDNSSDDVYSSKVRYDGAASIVSAKGFEIRKSIDIATPYQKKEHQGFDTIIKEAETFPDYPDNFSGKDADRLMNRSLSQWEETDGKREAESPRVAANTDTWGLSSDLNTSKIQEAIKDLKDRSIPNIGSNQYYDLPDTVEIEDPRTKIKYTYFKSTSGFRQDPDGSLVLYDGYGSEIRMTRGNIIISAASDVICRPGRDFHTMAGRHTALVSQKDVTVHSSQQDVYIKGDRNINVLSGINKEGGVLIDDRGDKGTVIRALNKTSLVAKDVFVGSIPENIPSSFTGASKGSGTVTIGGGIKTLVTGDNVSLYGKSIDTMAKDGSSVSWLSVASDKIVNISKNITLSGGVYVGKVSGDFTATVGSDPVFTNSSNIKTSLRIMPTVEVASLLMCKEVVANDMAAIRVYAENASGESNMRGHVTMPPLSVSPTELDNRSVVYEYTGPWDDSFNLGYSFKYPNSPDLGMTSSYVIPGMLWQTYLKKGILKNKSQAGTPKVWDEQTIPGIREKDEKSMVYPGSESWGSGVVTTENNKSEKINGGYVING